MEECEEIIRDSLIQFDNPHHATVTCSAGEWILSTRVPQWAVSVADVDVWGVLCILVNEHNNRDNKKIPNSFSGPLKLFETSHLTP